MRTPALLLALLLAAPLAAQAATCDLSIDSTDQMRFSKAELTVPAGCDTVRLTLTHSGKLPRNAMGHNWVLAETAQVQAVATDAIRAGVNNNYVPQGDSRILAATPLIGGGDQTSIEFSVADLKGKDLTFFCTFPGHSMMMRGKFIVN